MNFVSASLELQVTSDLNGAMERNKREKRELTGQAMSGENLE